MSSVSRSMRRPSTSTSCSLLGYPKAVRRRKRSSWACVATDAYGRVYAFNAGGGCPPGLAKKRNGCLPPGQAKKLYNVGQRYDRAYGSTWTYDQIPVQLRTQYSLTQVNRYYYNSGYLYQVDPQTMLIQRVISALLR